MGSSTTTTNNGVTTNEVHTANNNQNLSNTHTIEETTNIRNWDIVHGNDIKGGLTEIDGLYNTGTQVFKLQQLNFSQPRILAYQFTRDPTIITKDVTITPGSIKENAWKNQEILTFTRL